MREWAVKLEAKPKYVVSSTRMDFPWPNSHHIAGDLRTGVQKLKDATPAGVLLGSGKLATELDRLDLIDEYKFLVHPGSPVTARPCTRAGCPARDGSSWSRRSRSAAARSPCTTGARANSEQPHRAQLAGQRVVGRWRTPDRLGTWAGPRGDMRFATLGTVILDTRLPMGGVSRSQARRASLRTPRLGAAAASPMPDRRRPGVSGFHVFFDTLGDHGVPSLTFEMGARPTPATRGRAGRQQSTRGPDASRFQSRAGPRASPSRDRKRECSRVDALAQCRTARGSPCRLRPGTCPYRPPVAAACRRYRCCVFDSVGRAEHRAPCHAHPEPRRVIDADAHARHRHQRQNRGSRSRRRSCVTRSNTRPIGSSPPRRPAIPSSSTTEGSRSSS